MTFIEFNSQNTHNVHSYRSTLNRFRSTITDKTALKHIELVWNKLGKMCENDVETRDDVLVAEMNSLSVNENVQESIKTDVSNTVKKAKRVAKKKSPLKKKLGGKKKQWDSSDDDSCESMEDDEEPELVTYSKPAVTKKARNPLQEIDNLLEDQPEYFNVPICL